MQNQDTMKFNDIPVATWLIGFAFLGAGIYLFSIGSSWENTALCAAIGLVILLLAWGLTITANRKSRILRLQYWSLYLLRRSKEIPFDEIATIRVNSTRGMERRGRNSRSYRIEVVRKDNSVVPFRTGYSGSSFRKQKIVDQLRAFMGLNEAFDESPVGLFRAANNAASLTAASQQEAVTGSNDQEHVTNGVHWMLQSRALGTAPITRWYSPDFKTRESFLFLAQKVSGQSSGGLMAALSKTLFQQSLSLYGFSGGDTPNLSQAESVASLPPLIDFHFTAFTNSQAESRQILNPWAQNPLAEWAQRYPLKQLQSKGPFSQLVVLFSPNGVYLATMGILQPEQVEELTTLGVEMVKTQGVAQTT